MDTNVDTLTVLKKEPTTVKISKLLKAKNKRKWKVQLSERDKILLRDLFYSKGLDLEILLHRHFKNLHKTTAIHRLNRLSAGNYLEKVGFFENSKCKIVYHVTPKGLEAIENELSGGLIRRELKSSNLHHDLPLIRIFERMLTAKDLVELKTENELQSINFGYEDSSYQTFRRLNSDIYISFLIREKEYKVAIEFERTKKNSDRWIKYLIN